MSALSDLTRFPLRREHASLASASRHRSIGYRRTSPLAPVLIVTQVAAVTTMSLLVVGGFGAGVLGTSGGITSLIAYPVLLAAGITPFAANLTNSIALLGSGASSTARSRADLRGQEAALRRWIPVTVLASFAGAVLLVTTPSGVFDRIVPFLVAAGAVTLLFQPWIMRWQTRANRHIGTATATGLESGVALYNGYFGAGSGILTVALLMLTTEPVLHRANAFKNTLLFTADLLPAVVFAIVGPVVWSAVWPLGVGALAGGLIGPSVARRAPQDMLRTLIGLSGLGLAGYLLVK